MEINMDYSTICTINNLPKPKNATTEAIFDAKKKSKAKQNTIHVNSDIIMHSDTIINL